MTTKPCPYCEGKKYSLELDGDGYLGEVLCPMCEGNGIISDDNMRSPNPDAERP